MLDISFIRENPDLIREACLNKQLDSKIVDQLLEIDQKRRSIQIKVDDYRRQSNDNANEIKDLIFKMLKLSQL